jgi:hypothetical protein
MVWVLVLAAAAAALLWFIGAEEPRRRLRDAGFYLLCADVILFALWAGGVLEGRVG